MRIPDRTHGVHHHHPLRRLFHAHHKGLHHALRQCPCDRRCAPACREADAGQCRIIVNALRREIDRLMRQCGGDRHVSFAAFLESLRLAARELLDDLPSLAEGSSTTSALHPKSYAMCAPQSTRCADAEGLSGPLANHAHGYLQVTNLGTLLDVLG